MLRSKPFLEVRAGFLKHVKHFLSKHLLSPPWLFSKTANRSDPRRRVKSLHMEHQAGTRYFSKLAVGSVRKFRADDQGDSPHRVVQSTTSTPEPNRT
jgi:hypothetical protein